MNDWGTHRAEAYFSPGNRPARPGRPDADPADILLLSGGPVSACVLAELCKEGRAPLAVFVDYGQRAASFQDEASAALANYYGVPRQKLDIAALRSSGDEVEGRNALLVQLALRTVERRQRATIHLAIYERPGCRDCTPEFAQAIGRTLSVQTAGCVRLETPFLAWEGAMVLDRAVELGVPIRFTHSCIAGEECGRCRPCHERAALLARERDAMVPGGPGRAVAA